MNKKSLISIVSAALLFANFAMSNNSQAASHKVVVSRNSIVYTIHGKKTRGRIRKGREVAYTSSKWIKGNKYYRIGKNRYIRQENTHEKVLFKVTATYDDDSGRVYTKPGKLTRHYLAVSGGNVYQQYRDKSGQLWYRIGKNAWIKAKYTDKPNGQTNPKTTKSKKKATKKKASKKTSSKRKSSKQYSISKNAASLMSYLANNSSLSESQRNNAIQAATLIKTGTISGQSAPSWFSKDVSLTSRNDATSAQNIKASLAVLTKMNQVRRQYGLPEFKVSPVTTAIAMIDADYQKQAGLAHPSYYQYGSSSENLASGGDAVKMWMGEKADWQYNVKRNPSLAPYEHQSAWTNEYLAALAGQNGYRTAGHYLNMVNQDSNLVGVGVWSGVTAADFDSNDSSTGLTVTQYSALVNEWLKK